MISNLILGKKNGEKYKEIFWHFQLINNLYLLRNLLRKLTLGQILDFFNFVNSRLIREIDIID